MLQCPDITKLLTPDLKRPGESRLIYIDIGHGKYRMGGSALAHVYNQLGEESPDLDEPAFLKNVFNAIQEMISEDLILSGHDRSDGGLITTLLEMAFGGNCGFEVNIEVRTEEISEDMKPQFRDFLTSQKLSVLFSEELGVIFEYITEKEEQIKSKLQKYTIPYQIIGNTTKEPTIKISVNNELIIQEDMRLLRAIWEETSYQIEKLQANPECVEEEWRANLERKGPQYKLTFIPQDTPEHILNKEIKPKIAIIREEGSNGDREMAAAFYQAGFEVWDVMMTDLLEEKVKLDDFKGIAFVGGFSYADVLDSAKGWAGVIRFNRNSMTNLINFMKGVIHLVLESVMGVSLWLFLVGSLGRVLKIDSNHDSYKINLADSNHVF